MLGIDYGAARNVAIGVIVVFVVLMFLFAIIIKNITTKLISVLLMAGLALGVWTQRSSLKDCKDRVVDRAEVGDTSDLTCTFFGTDVKIDEADPAE